MSKRSTKVLSGALVTTTVLGGGLGATNAMAASNVDDLYKIASDAMLAAEKEKTQEKISEARKAIRELNKALKNDKALQQQLVGFLSSRLDPLQHELFIGFYDILFKKDGSKKEKLSQKEINRAKKYIIGFNSTPENKDYVPSWSKALDDFQAENIKKVYGAIEKAQKSKEEKDIKEAKELVDELVTVENNDGVKEFAQKLEIMVSDLLETKIVVESVKVIDEETLEVKTVEEQEKLPSFVVKDGDNVVKTVIESKKGDTTKKIFTVTLGHANSLANKQGEIIVNNKSIKYDNKCPEIIDVEAISKNRVMVTFSEEVEVLEKDKINVISIVTGAKLEVNSAIVQANKKNVLLTLGAPMKSGKYNCAVSMDAGAVKDVYTDIANKNVDYEVVFNGLGVADIEGATLLSAQYEKDTKKVTLAFNKEMAAQLELSKVTINDIALTEEDNVVQEPGDSSKFVVTLSEATKKKIDDVKGKLTIKVSKDAVADKFDEKLKNVETILELEVKNAQQ